MGLQPQEKKKKKGKIGENWSQKLLWPIFSKGFKIKFEILKKLAKFTIKLEKKEKKIHTRNNIQKFPN
jgi:hypothetical protein